MTLFSIDVGSPAEPMIAGDSRVLTFTMVDAAGAPTALDPLLITAATWVLSDPYTGLHLLEKTLLTGVSVDLDADVINVLVDEGETSALHGNYPHELTLVHNVGTVSTVARGTVFIRRKV